MKSFFDSTLYNGRGGFMIRNGDVVFGIREDEVDDNLYQVAREKIRKGECILPPDLFLNADSYRRSELRRLLS